MKPLLLFFSALALCVSVFSGCSAPLEAPSDTATTVAAPTHTPAGAASTPTANSEQAIAQAKQLLAGYTLHPNEQYAFAFGDGYAILSGSEQPITAYAEIETYDSRLGIPATCLGLPFKTLTISYRNTPRLQFRDVLPTGLALQEVTTVQLKNSDLLLASVFYAADGRTISAEIRSPALPDFALECTADTALAEEGGYQIWGTEAGKATALCWQDEAWHYRVTACAEDIQALLAQPIGDSLRGTLPAQDTVAP
ncbi:MAG: hypothetical protein PHO10_00740 [Gemmiger sp.]|nr:hypothetical protein [Gemmiger sp.]